MNKSHYELVFFKMLDKIAFAYIFICKTNTSHEYVFGCEKQDEVICFQLSGSLNPKTTETCFQLVHNIIKCFRLKAFGRLFLPVGC